MQIEYMNCNFNKSYRLAGSWVKRKYQQKPDKSIIPVPESSSPKKIEATEKHSFITFKDKVDAILQEIVISDIEAISPSPFNTI